jgi:DNA polymerase-3 subunit delta'
VPFRDLKGHRAQLALLARALKRDALPQSLVFAGPEGVGKRLVALAVAHRLNCLSAAPDDADACGASPAVLTPTS